LAAAFGHFCVKHQRIPPVIFPRSSEGPAPLSFGACFCETALFIQPAGRSPRTVASLGISAPMIFCRLWEQISCRQVIEQIATGRGGRGDHLGTMVSAIGKGTSPLNLWLYG
jgi:hypothetical protein